MLRLCEASRRDVYVFYGDFRMPDILPTGEMIGTYGAHFNPAERPQYDDPRPDFGTCWGECILCAQGNEYEFYGIDRAQHWQEHFKRVHPTSKRPDVTPWMYSLTDSPRLRKAYEQARSARFEHGEQG